MLANSSKIQIERSHDGRVAHLILNAPENLNAMDLGMAEAFRGQKVCLEKDTTCRIVVIRGRGRAFSAGGELEMLREKAFKSKEQNEREMMAFYLSFLSLRELNIPLICLLHGHVVGAGFCFAAACDIRLCEDTTLMAAPFTRLALHPGMGGSFFLPRAFGSEVARELMLTGRRMGAEEALKRGFVSSVVSASEREEKLDALLESVLKSAPEATQALLRVQREREHEALSEALLFEAREQAACYARQEFLDGIEALQGKSTPPWA